MKNNKADYKQATTGKQNADQNQAQGQDKPLKDNKFEKTDRSAPQAPYKQNPTSKK